MSKAYPLPSLLVEHYRPYSRTRGLTTIKTKRGLTEDSLTLETESQSFSRSGEVAPSHNSKPLVPMKKERHRSGGQPRSRKTALRRNSREESVPMPEHENTVLPTTGLPNMNDEGCSIPQRKNDEIGEERAVAETADRVLRQPNHERAERRSLMTRGSRYANPPTTGTGGCVHRQEPQGQASEAQDEFHGT